MAILLFDEVEVLDFAGPFEVFSLARLPGGERPFNVFTVSEKPGPVAARNQLSINPGYAFRDCPPPDILVIPGGYGTRPLLENRPVLDWIHRGADHAELVLSVCSGALLLAKAGLLDGLTATTHHEATEELEALAPQTQVVRGERYRDNGKVITSAGVAAGIDMAFHVVDRLCGREVARDTAIEMEYNWRREA